jgi:hypothetical protein
MNHKSVRLLLPILVLAAALFVLVGSALANTDPPTYCGEVASAVDGLGLGKKVKCEKNETWTWDILKDVDQPSLTLATGESFVVNYTVTASATAAGDFRVYGPTAVRNLTAAPIEIVSVSDSLGKLACPVEFPYMLAPNETLECWYDETLIYQPTVNTLTVVRGDGKTGSVSAPIDWTKAGGTTSDACALVSDTFAGELGTVCAGAETSFTFTYARTIGPYDVCGSYMVDNVASFVTDTSGTTGSDDATVLVDVPCGGGCTLTPGYWKTHSIFGPAPYDMTWDYKAGGNAEFLDTGMSYYQVLWTSSSGGNAFYILAHPFIAAEMNVLNHASIPANVLDAWNQAKVLLTKYQYTLLIPKGADRDLAISLAGILDSYNNGLLGPGHCSE